MDSSNGFIHQIQYFFDFEKGLINVVSREIEREIVKVNDSDLEEELKKIKITEVK